MMTQIQLGIAALALSVLLCLGQEASAQTAAIDWQVKAYADGRHNAFTDLVRWRGAYYLCFRHAESHMSMDGEIRVVRSDDLRTWTPCGTLKTLGDDRDPHFAATDDELFVYFGVWDLRFGEGAALPDRGSVRSHFASTRDGETWSDIRAVYEPGWWLWRVRVIDGVFYSDAYTAVRPTPPMREIRLLRSTDGLDWERVSTVTTERSSGESDFWRRPDGTMWMISRTGEAPGNAWLAKSDASLEQWNHTDLGVLIHAPVVAFWHDRIFMAGRARRDPNDPKSGSVTRLWELVGDKPIELLTLPSGGDTSYPGLIADPESLNGEQPALYISWYSQHEKGQSAGDTEHAASIYVARIKVE